MWYRKLARSAIVIGLMFWTVGVETQNRLIMVIGGGLMGYGASGGWED